MASRKKAFYGLLPFIILAVIPWITYCNTLHNDFVFDDLALIAGNDILPSLTDVTSLKSVITQKYLYRPVRTLSYAIDYHFSGPHPLSYHVSNITYHVFTTLLVYLTTLCLLNHRAAAFFTALLFSVHPVHTDSVTYLAGRRDILFTLFYFLGFYAFLKYRQTERIPFMLLAMSAYLLSIGAKEMGVTLPALFLLYDLVKKLPQEPAGGRLLPARKIASTLKTICTQHKYLYSTLFMGALAFSLYKIFIRSPSHQKEYYGDSAVVTLLTVFKILLYYIKLLVLPVTLVADYSFDAFPLASSPLEGSVLSSMILLLLILLVLLRMLTTHKWIAFGGFWFFVTLLPVCHIIPHHELLAEHYLYLPSYGFCLIVAILFTRLREEKRFSLPALSLFTVIIVLFSLRIVDRNRDWQDGMALWSKTVSTVPRCARAQSNLGVEHLIRGRYQVAQTHLEAALALKPDYAEAHNNMGLIYENHGLYDLALSFYGRAALLKRGYFDTLANIANTLEEQGHYDRAISLYTFILQKKPEQVNVLNSMGIVYQKRGDHSRAREYFSRALKVNPFNLEARNNLGTWYQTQGWYDQAIEEFRQALVLQPDSAEVRCNLGTVYISKGWYNRAIDELKESLRLKPDSIEAMNNLGSAYRSKGEYDLAREIFEKTLELNPQLSLPHLNLALIYLNQERDTQKASYHLERALEIEPDTPHAKVIREKIDSVTKEDRSPFRRGAGE